MIKVIPTTEQLRRATRLSNNLPLFSTSITKNRYGRHGLLAEILYAESGLLPPHVEFETKKPQLYDHDLIDPRTGITFEVKTRVMNARALPPPPFYSVHLSEHSCTKQNPDWFLFAMCDRQCTTFYLLGAMRNEDKYSLTGRKLRKAGQSGDWFVHRSVNTYPISALTPLHDFKDTLLKDVKSISESRELDEGAEEGPCLRCKPHCPAIHSKIQEAGRVSSI